MSELQSEQLSHLKELEAESIHILRETAAEFARPVMLYSIGKDSQVLLHLARKAFHPAPLPFPLLHVDTTWKFQEMYRFRDEFAARHGLRLLVHQNRQALAEGMNPFDHTSQKYIHAMKTQALLEALALHGFDAAFGGARRDEEKSRAKERVYSFRDRHGQWEPRRQRPELWNLYNGRIDAGESMRVFPLSNWTELDVWHYILRERIPVVPLYFAAERPVVDRGGTWLMVDDDRMRLRPGERPVSRRVRFRTLGCYPLSGAIESSATTVEDVISEMLLVRHSERQGRLIDHDEEGSMELKKREGYF
jgi:sulfate adenylyltransferase subunit 2